MHPADPDAPGRRLLFKDLPADVLPRTTARSLYNVLTALEDAVNLRLEPATDDDAEPEVLVCGASTYLPVESITGMTLLGAIHRLSGSVSAVRARLAGEDDYDQWAIDSGARTPGGEDEDE
jgi:hypothetical protein